MMDFARKLFPELGRAACMLLVLGLAGRVSAAPPGDAGRALKEMAELEARIEQVQRRQAEEQRRLLEASRSLDSVDRNLQGKDGLDKEGGQFLKDYVARARAGLEEVERRQAADRAEIQTARAAAALTGARLGAESAGRASADASLLALGLLHELHRGRARIATQRLQDAEARREGLAGQRDHAQKSAAYQTIFSEYSLEQLRARHRDLAHEVAQAQSEADRQLAEIGQLAGRHEELKGLIAKLAEQEAARAATTVTATVATPTPNIFRLTPNIITPAPNIFRPTPLPSPAPAEDVGHPALPTNISDNSAFRIPHSALPGAGEDARAPGGADEGVRAPRVPEVPYEEGSEPMASAERAGGDRDQTEAAGTRYLFWRARPVGVCALAGGKVIFSGAFAGYRHLLIVDHGDGWRSLYGNLAQCSLKTDEPVKAGQTVGIYQADQAARAEPLWFEVRQGAQAVAPESWPALPVEWQARILAQVEK